MVEERSRLRLVRLCAAVSGDSAAAEDLAQETLLEAWRNRHKLRDADGIERWLAAIARNVCLRWRRQRGREVALVPLDSDPAAEDQLERAELVEDLDRALGQLPPETRELLVHRYVGESPPAEIGERFGLSPDAVSMRLARGKALLRRLLADETGGAGWRETRVWCRDCGRARLEMRLPGVAFRCPACTRSETASEFPLDNPAFAELLHGVVRPTAILRRTAEWAHRYFAPGAGGQVACTRCGRATRLRRYSQDRDGRENAGLLADCAGCAEQVCSSVSGLVVSVPGVARFRRDHPRSRSLPQRVIAFAGRPAIVVRHGDLLGSTGVDVVLARDTLRLIDVLAA